MESNAAKVSEAGRKRRHPPITEPSVAAVQGTEQAGDRPFGQGKRGENVGRWTKEEHEVFLRGLEGFGKDWKRISSMIPSRTVVQIRTHAQKYFQKIAKSQARAAKASSGHPASVPSTASNTRCAALKRRSSHGSAAGGSRSRVSSPSDHAAPGNGSTATPLYPPQAMGGAVNSPSSTDARTADARAYPLTPPAPPQSGGPARRRPRALSVASNSSTSTAAAAEEQAVGMEADAAASLFPADRKLYRLPNGAMRRAPPRGDAAVGEGAGPDSLQHLLGNGSAADRHAVVSAAIAAAYSQHAAGARTGRQRRGEAAANAPFLRLAHPNAFMWCTAHVPAAEAKRGASGAAWTEQEAEEDQVAAVEMEEEEEEEEEGGESGASQLRARGSLGVVVDTAARPAERAGGLRLMVEGDGAEGAEGAAPLTESPRKRRRTRADSMTPVSYSMLVEHAHATVFEGAEDEPAAFVGMGAEL